MKIAFNSTARKRLVVGVAVAFAVVYVGLAASRFAASWLGSRVQLSSLQKAAWLDPGNADYRNHLGRFYDLVARDPASAVGQYQAAVRLNPHSARFWFDLASAYQVLGDTAAQTAALERAIQADSMTPDVAWEAANLYLVQGENEKALREFRVVLANDPSLAEAAIQYGSKSANRGFIPQETTIPRVERKSGRTTAASEGPSECAPTSGLTTLPD